MAESTHTHSDTHRHTHTLTHTDTHTHTHTDTHTVPSLLCNWVVVVTQRVSGSLQSLPGS